MQMANQVRTSKSWSTRRWLRKRRMGSWCLWIRSRLMMASISRHTRSTMILGSMVSSQMVKRSIKSRPMCTSQP